MVLEAIWGSLGGVFVLCGIILQSTSNGEVGPALLLVGFLFLGVGIARQLQSRNARARNDL